MDGVIYMILSKNTEKVYIGKTTQKLSVRLCKHLSKLNNTRSKIVVSYGDISIKIIDSSDDLDELKIKEQEYIQFYKDVAVNHEVYKEKNIEQNKNISKGEYDFINWYENNIEVCNNCLRRSDLYRKYVLNSETVLSKQNFFELMTENAGEVIKHNGIYCYKNIGFKSDNNSKNIKVQSQEYCVDYENWIINNVLRDTTSKIIRSSIWKKFESTFQKNKLSKKTFFENCEKILGNAVKTSGIYCFPGYKLIC